MAQQQHPLKYSNPEVYQALVVSPRLSGAEKYIYLYWRKKKVLITENIPPLDSASGDPNWERKKGQFGWYQPRRHRQKKKKKKKTHILLISRVFLRQVDFTTTMIWTKNELEIQSQITKKKRKKKHQPKNFWKKTNKCTIKWMNRRDFRQSQNNNNNKK